MQRLLSFFSLLIFSTCFHAQDSASVLFIGNSYTYVNNLPSLFQNIAVSKGKSTFVDTKTNGGATMQFHANDPSSYQKMNSSDWNYVVLQAQSQEPSFPFGQVNTQTLPYAVQLADSANEISSCSQAMFFMTWGRENGDPQWDSINTFDKMNYRLRNAYLRFADSSNSVVAPVGVAWKYVRDNHPEINLYSGDGSHPGLAGSYLSACTFFASIFHQTPEGSSFSGGLEESVASILQQAAALSVLDSMDVWGLEHHDSLVEVNFVCNHDGIGFTVEFEETVDHTDSIFWDFGDGNTSTDSSPEHTYSNSGEYQVQLIAYNACTNDTVVQNIIVEPPLGNIGNFVDKDQYLLKRISAHVFELRGIDHTSINDFKVIDLLGREVPVTFRLKSENIISVEVHHNASFIFSFSIDNMPYRLKVI